MVLPKLEIEKYGNRAILVDIKTVTTLFPSEYVCCIKFHKLTLSVQ